MVRHPDSIMLDWVGEYVTEISSLKVKKGEMMQLSASDEDDSVLITRRGKTDVEVFRKCVKAAMKQIPRMPNAEPSERARKT